MSIKIIGAGLPRTGTNTLKAALELLGYQSTYHFKDILNNPEQINHWLQMQSKLTMDWDTVYKGYQASVDFPAYAWYKQHMVQYPEAKIILSVRPFEDWYESVKNTLWISSKKSTEEYVENANKAYNKRHELIKQARIFVRDYLWTIQFENKFEDKDFVRGIWHDHLAKVKAHVPEEKLLVYQVTEEWEPLCAFLNKNIPDIDFPHLNKSGNFTDMMTNLMKGDKI